MKDARSGKGLMQYLSAAFSYACADLSLFSAFLDNLELHHAASGKKLSESQVSCVIPERLSLALSSWSDVFSTWDRSCPIVGQFSPVARAQTIGLYDASTSWGAGGVFWSEAEPGVVRVFAHRWSSTELQQSMRASSKSTGLLESIAGLMWLQRFIERCSGTRLCLLGDNSSVVLGYHRSYSKLPDLSRSFREGRRLVSKFGVRVRSRYIHTSLNVIADLLSRGCFVQAKCISDRLGLRLLWD